MYGTSCNDSDTERQLLNSKIELEESAAKMEGVVPESDDILEEKVALIEFYKKVKNNLVLCDNFKYILRVDRLHNGDFRYACWKKPKTTFDRPDLVLRNGHVVENGKTDSEEYLFFEGDWTYSVEKITVKEHHEIVHIFLEIHNRGSERYAWKMRDLTMSKFAIDE